jgi:F-type H+-transporting ATPase subunit delta
MATAAAKRYARAVFEIAQEEGDLTKWSRRLAELSVVLSDKELAAVLTNPTIDVNRRMELIAGAPHAFDPETTNLAKLLIEAGRVHEAAAIAGEYDRLTDEAAGRVRATVTTSVELDTEERDRVAAELSKRIGKEVKLDLVVDPLILGGMKLQFGDHLVDASVSTKLQQLRRRLAAS